MSAAFTDAHYFAAALFLIAMFNVFLVFGSSVVGMVFGKPSAPPSLTRFRDHFTTGWPIVAALSLSLMLGVYLPPQFKTLLTEGAEFVEHPQALDAIEPDSIFEPGSLFEPGRVFEPGSSLPSGKAAESGGAREVEATRP